MMQQDPGEAPSSRPQCPQMGSRASSPLTFGDFLCLLFLLDLSSTILGDLLSSTLAHAVLPGPTPHVGASETGVSLARRHSFRSRVLFARTALSVSVVSVPGLLSLRHGIPQHLNPRSIARNFTSLSLGFLLSNGVKRTARQGLCGALWDNGTNNVKRLTGAVATEPEEGDAC